MPRAVSIIIQTCPATRSSISSMISLAHAANSSSTTTDSARDATPTRRWPRRARVLGASRRPRAHARATRLSSGAKTGPSGSSRSGAASSAASSSCRSTTGRRRISSRASARIVSAGLMLVGQDVPPPSMPRRRSGSCTSSTGAAVAGLAVPSWLDGTSGRSEPARRHRPRRCRRDHLHVRRDRRAQRAWSSPTATSWRTSCRSNARS